jgi:peptide/nickel transport system permease protein
MNWITKRLAMAAVTVWGVITIAFALVRLMPGSPTDYIVAQFISSGSGASTNVDMSAIHARVEAYINVNPSEPLWQQYLNYVTSMLSGDLGRSIWYSDPVVEVLGEALPWTVFVMGIATILSFVMGIALGAAMAYVEGSNFDRLSSIGMIVTNSTPYYLFAIALILVFAYQFELFPAVGRVGSGLTPGSVDWYLSVLWHSALPIASMVITTMGGVALSMRGNSIQVLGEDYLRVARLRGLPKPRIALRYVARNAVLPLYTGMMIAVGNIFGGAIIVEVIFGYYGIGYYMYQAVLARDYPLLMGGFIVITVAVVIALLFADLTYGWLDPRAGSGGEAGA